MFGNTNVTTNLSTLTKNVDAKILNWLVDMHTTLNKDKIDLRQLDNLIKILQHYNEDAKEEYINTLLYPETVIGRKIPTLFPIPSTTFQMHLVSANINIGNTGAFGWTWNPFFLADSTPAQATSFFVNTLTDGAGAAANNFNPVGIQMNQIPPNIYGNYRLVSASVVVSYVGRMDVVSGVLGIGIGLNNTGVAQPVAVGGAADVASQVFANFIQVDNLYFSERTQAANGVRAIYFPMDDKYTNFYPLYTTAQPGGAGGPGAALAATYASGFYFAGYGQGLQVQANSIRFDFYLNFETVVSPAFNNFIPQTTGNAQNINVIQTASDVINSSPSLVVKAGSDIPGKSDDNIGSMGTLTKLVKDSDNTILPSVDIIKRMIYKNNY